MRRLRDLLVVFMLVALVSPAAAGWFDFDEEQYAACNQKYFAKPEAVFADFLTLDLSIIEHRDEAKMLYRQLKKMVEPKRAALDELVIQYEAKGPDVERFFNTLYTKEIHDELWEKTRPLKQAAYKKAITERTAIFMQIRTEATSVLQAEAIADALYRIGKQFKEVTP
mgnify:FL=1